MNKQVVKAELAAAIAIFPFNTAYREACDKHPGFDTFQLWYDTKTGEIEFKPVALDHDDPYTGYAEVIYIGTMNFVSAAHWQQYRDNKLFSLDKYLDI